MNDAVHVDLFNENTADGAKTFTSSPAGNFPQISEVDLANKSVH